MNEIKGLLRAEQIWTLKKKLSPISVTEFISGYFLMVIKRYIEAPVLWNYYFAFFFVLFFCFIISPLKSLILGVGKELIQNLMTAENWRCINMEQWSTIRQITTTCLVFLQKLQFIKKLTNESKMDGLHGTRLKGKKEEDRWGKKKAGGWARSGMEKFRRNHNLKLY